MSGGRPEILSNNYYLILQKSNISLHDIRNIDNIYEYNMIIYFLIISKINRKYLTR